MIFPSIGSLMEKVDSKYTLAVVAAKRARQLTEGAPRLSNCSSEKEVTIAIYEINEGKISYVRTKNVIK
ncbi:MAG TPA: DNA-directed RNA polymerase subunit omega [Clostridiales bacterium]|nr:DNA-directed RNA polymerase subunit omega [Clostridiales bacterium]